MLDRLSMLDVSFLQIESPHHRMQLLALFVFEGPPPSLAEFSGQIERRMPLVPRFRQRVASVPLHLGRPAWIDDVEFDLGYHVRHTALPAPGGEDELRTLCGRLFASPLEMTRPLWEMWLVEGLQDGRFAVATKFHHAMVDGVSFTDITAKLFHEDPEAPAPLAVPWSPRPEPSPLRLAAGSVIDGVVNPAEAVLGLRNRLTRPAPLVRQVMRDAAAMARFSRVRGSAPATSLNEGRSGPTRRTDWVRVPLEDMRATKASLDTTINNVVLAAVAGAFGRYFAERGEEVEGLRAMVPVSVRLEADKGALGNQVATLYPMLPVDEPDPVERVRRVVSEIEQLREADQAVGAQALSEIGEFAPPTIMAQVARLHYRGRFFNLVVTNVPGPRRPLHLCGRRMIEMLPTLPVTAHHGVAISVVSYVDTMVFGVTTDPARVADGERIAELLSEALAELREVAIKNTRAPVPRR